MTIRRSGVKMYLSLITAPIVLALIINFLNRQCNVNRIVILQIRSAKPIQDMNISAPTYWRWRILSATTKSGNGNRFFKWKQHVQIANDPQSPQCQTKAELLWPSLPPHFSLPSTFNLYDFTKSQATSYKHFQCQNRRFGVVEAGNWKDFQN
jgi:hypothetical protein